MNPMELSRVLQTLTAGIAAVSKAIEPLQATIASLPPPGVLAPALVSLAQRAMIDEIGKRPVPETWMDVMRKELPHRSEDELRSLYRYSWEVSSK
jgi:hypothetical protein